MPRQAFGLPTRSDRLAESQACCWPECIKRSIEPPYIPLCRRHLLKAWKFVNEEAQVVLREATRTSRRPVGEGQVYFIRFDQRIKIGFTKNLGSRLCDLPHDEVLAVMPGTMADEARCHAAFKHLRETGEWFRIDSDLMDFIEDMAATSPLDWPGRT